MVEILDEELLLQIKKIIPTTPQNVVRDLGRSMGFVTDVVTPKLMADYSWVMGLWTASGRAMDRRTVFPILTRWRVGTVQCDVIFPGLPQWLPYREAALHLASANTRSRDYGETLRWWRTILSETIEESLIIVEAHKSRMWWRWLTNSKLTQDHVEVAPGEQLFPSVLERLRVVRCRFGEETPQWYVASKLKQGHTSGVFKVDDGIWYSLQPRLSNLSLRNHFRRLESPKVLAWTPGIVELVPVGFKDEASAQLAVLFVHQLRNMLPHFDSPVVLPLPIHLGKKLAENILGVEVN